ncbi:hypothetical protein M885DRAFT_552525 [Pelagophyceae sp. CCMP2097]|nr:hypothetical protein M885DRAFT_552525 [Pelagophyceae sp. CCMP2097]
MSNPEALALYREILRVVRRFHWCNDRGEPWNVLLKASAKKEFIEARYERDPLLVARMLVVGRQCIDDMTKKFDATSRDITDKVENSRARR